MFSQLNLQCYFVWFESESLILRRLDFITATFNHLLLQLSEELLRYKICDLDLGIRNLSAFQTGPRSFKYLP